MSRVERDPRRGLTAACTTIAATALVVGGLGSSRPAFSHPFYAFEWMSAYPGSESMDNVMLGTGQACQLCHTSSIGGNGWNGYGWELRTFITTGSTIQQALMLAEGIDSDVDPTGSTNLVEIQADTQPGWTDGPNNAHYFDGGTVTHNNNPPAGILGSLDPAPGIGTSYCFGDGSGTACPCSNPSAPGAGEGCANSSGLGGIVQAGGSSSVAADDLTFDAAQLLPAQPGLLFAGNAAAAGGAGVVFGDGLRCAAVNVVRLGIKTPSGAGTASWGPNLGAIGNWGAGDTRYFQVWYRDPGGPCGSNFNLSNALEVTFTP